MRWFPFRLAGLAAAPIVAGAMVHCANAEALAEPIPQGARVISDAREEALRELGELGAAGRWRDAERHAREWLRTHPDDELMLFNLACAQSRQGDQRGAAESLRQSMHAGFAEWSHLDQDPDLSALRQHDSWESITALRDTLRSSARRQPDGLSGTRERLGIGPGPTGRAERVLADWKARHGEDGYRFERDDVRRLIFISSLDPIADTEMKSALRSQADHQIEALFGEAQPDTIVVAIPSLDDAPKYLDSPSTPDGPTQGGVYDHGERALISRDIGASLRHEYTHALHWGHMDRLHQRHPTWIQEGLAALYESYDITESGRVKFRPNERHNIVWDALNRGAAPPLATLFSMSNDEFIDPSGVLVHYAMARSVFEHLASQRKVEDFYKAYVAGFEEDPTGRQALEVAWGKSIDKVEDGWRSWVKRRGAIDDTVGSGDASLGIAGRDAGDGVAILSVASGSPAEKAGLQAGDVVVQVGPRTVRSQLELQLDMARRKVGEKVEVRFRRGDSYSTVSVTLAPLRRQRDR